MNLFRFAAIAFGASFIAILVAVLVIGFVFNGFHPTPETFF